VIGRYLRTLTDEQLDRVLTGKMRPRSYIPIDHSGPCLVGAACGIRTPEDYVTSRELTAHFESRWGAFQSVETRYDALCLRFGLERANAAIRERAVRILGSRQPVRRYPMTTGYAGLAVEAARTTWAK
jgi:hypothetical protein